MSRHYRDTTGDAWFRIGAYDVTTTVFAAGLFAVTMVATLFAPVLAGLFYFSPGLVASGQVWRAVTWPLASGFSIFGVLNIVFFWFFGTDLERVTGRVRMAWFLIWTWAALTAGYTVAALLFGGQSALLGPGLIQFLVLLVWIAENPRRPMFFRIQAWVVGAVLAGLNVLQLLAARDFAGIAALALAAGFCAIAARRAGLLSAYDRIPGKRRPPKPKAYKQPDSPTPRRERQRATDSQRMDDLLDKISRDGLHSLSDSERKELLKLRERRRGGA